MISNLIKIKSISQLGKSINTPSLMWSKLYSSEINADDGAKSVINYQLTEELPPIPPNYGWRGDKNIESIFKIRTLQESFKYGFV